MKQLTAKQIVVKLTNNLNYHDHHHHLFAFMCITNFKNIQQVVRRGDLRKPPGLQERSPRHHNIKEDKGCEGVRQKLTRKVF